MVKEIELLKQKLAKTEELLTLYRHDKLTGLLMRRDFEYKFSEFFESKETFYLTLIDVNGLKSVNSNPELGYEAGDELIVSVSYKICNFFDNVVYRIGGDEFAVLSYTPCAVYDSLDPSYTCATLSNKNFSSIREMVKGVDRELIKKKVEFYKNNENSRRK